MHLEHLAYYILYSLCSFNFANCVLAPLLVCGCFLCYIKVRFYQLENIFNGYFKKWNNYIYTMSLFMYNTAVGLAGLNKFIIM